MAEVLLRRSDELGLAWQSVMERFPAEVLLGMSDQELEDLLLVDLGEV